MQQGVKRLQSDLTESAMARHALLVLACVIVGLLGGVATAAISPFAGFAAVAALGAVVVILVSPLAGILAFAVVAYTLPFAVVPVPIGGVKLSLIDIILTLCLAVWIIRLLVKPNTRLAHSPLDLPIALFLGLAVTSFMLGVESTQVEAARFFLKAVNSVLLFFTVTNCVRNRRQVEAVLIALSAAAIAAAVLGIVLYFLDRTLVIQLLSGLRVLGYPSGAEVLRFIAGTDRLRATGTSIDPNVFGGMLTLVIPLVAAQLFSRAPVLSRRYIGSALLILVICLGLTISRGSWLGTTAGVLLIATLKYRRVWLAFVVFLLVMYFIPQGDFAAGHLQSGLTAEDQAAAMRLGEYKDALRLIAAYPWFGVGFGGAPSIDYYVGASSIYLLMAEEMGLIGLGVFLTIVAVALTYALRNMAKIADPRLQAAQVGILGGLVGALVAGLFDHHYFNLKFPHAIALFWFFAGLLVVATRIGIGETNRGSLEEG